MDFIGVPRTVDATDEIADRKPARLVRKAGWVELCDRNASFGGCERDAEAANLLGLVNQHREPR